jgi:hypothetical protein
MRQKKHLIDANMKIATAANRRAVKDPEKNIGEHQASQVNASSKYLSVPIQ